MKNQNILSNEILSIALGVSTNELENQFDDELLKEMHEEIETWINKYNVKEIEYYVNKNELEDICIEPEELTNLTNSKINFLDYDEFYEMKDKVLSGNIEGSGWDGQYRDETSYNKEYFYTGSDGSYYIIVKKLN